MYRVATTAGFDIEIAPPILAAKTYTVTLTFRLLIDTDAIAVETGSPTLLVPP